MEHYSNFYTFEIASLVNVSRQYLRKYGSLVPTWFKNILPGPMNDMYLDIKKFLEPAMFCHLAVLI